jgi:hypothetical protein
MRLGVVLVLLVMAGNLISKAARDYQMPQSCDLMILPLLDSGIVLSHVDL